MNKKLLRVCLFLMVTVSLIFSACANKESNVAAENPIKEKVKEVAKEIKTNKSNFPNLTKTVTDYSNPENWMCKESDVSKEVDLFYIYPTVSIDGKGQKVAPIDDNMKAAAKNVFSKQAICLSGFTNVYVPYYRQMYMSAVEECKTNEELDNELRTGEGRTDLYAALDYYFENCNQGRPFIFASHSQGTSMLKIILEEYMGAHPEYLKRMICSYALGYSFTKDDYEKYPHIKPATGERDTGVVISWNIEGPNATKDSFVVLPNSITINPLNWSVTETPASVEDNFGSLGVNDAVGSTTMVEGKADATVNLERGVVVCTTQDDYIESESFGDKSLHTHDWGFYAENIRRNAIKRTAAYLGHYPFTGYALDYSNSDNWYYIEKNIKHKVDSVYIYPTVVNGRKGQIIAQIDDELKMGVASAFSMQGSALEDFTNVFVPYYRQVPLTTAFGTKSNEAYKELLRSDVTITDVYAALDYYFEKLNDGRPFIFTSHSQGSAIMNIVLAEYMKKHPEYLKRMVCAYALGYAFTEDYFKNNPHLKFATGETDTGVVIAWNTEAPNAPYDSMLLSTLSRNLNINPLNWKTDDTYASIDQNLGSLNKDKYLGHYYVGKGKADAQIDLNRGSLICTTIKDSIINLKGFGGNSLHGDDWGAYYVNIRENAKKRIDSFLNANINYDSSKKTISQDEWASAKKFVQLSTGIKMAYVEMGDPAGEVVILQHGMTDNSRSWSLAAPYFVEAGYHVYLPDLRGQGKSEESDGYYTTYTYATDLNAFFKAMNIDKAIVIGHSLGSFTMQTFYQMFPEKCSKVVLVSSIPLRGYQNKTLNETYKKFIQPLGIDEHPSDEFMDKWYGGDIKEEKYKEEYKTFISYLKAESKQLSKKTWKNIILGLVGSSLRNLYLHFDRTVPVLVLHGNDDTMTKTKYQAELLKLLKVPKENYKNYKNVGHNIQFEIPEQSSNDIISWLKTGILPK